MQQLNLNIDFIIYFETLEYGGCDDDVSCRCGEVARVVAVKPTHSLTLSKEGNLY